MSFQRRARGSLSLGARRIRFGLSSAAVRVALIAVLLLGCEGERVVSAPADAEVSEASDVAVAADAGTECDEIPGNVVPNPSFEDVVGDNVASWRDGRLVAVTGEADHCERYAKLVEGAAWTTVSERIPISAPAGATLEFGMSLRVLDDNYSDVVLLLTSADDKQVSQPQRALPRDKTWVRVAGSLTLTAPVTEMIVGVNTNADKPRSLGLDRVWLRIKP